MSTEREKVEAKLQEIIGFGCNNEDEIRQVMSLFDATVAVIYNRGVEHGVQKTMQTMRLL